MQCSLTLLGRLGRIANAIPSALGGTPFPFSTNLGLDLLEPMAPFMKIGIG